MLNKIIQVGLQSSVVKISAMYRDILILRAVGLGGVLDYYLLALVIPSFIGSLCGATISACLTRGYLKNKSTEGFRGDRVILLAVLVLLLQVFSFFLLYLFAMVSLKVDLKLFELLIIDNGWLIFFLSLCFCVFYSLSLVVLAVVNAEGYYSVGQGLQLIVPALMILIIEINIFEYVVENFLLMLIMGLALQLLLGVLFLNKKIILDFRMTIVEVKQGTKKMLKEQFPILITSSAAISSTYIDSIMASDIGVGMLSVYTYGMKIPMAVGGVAAIGIGGILLPYFTKLYLEKDPEIIKKEFMRLCLIVLLCGGISSYVLACWSEEIMVLLVGSHQEIKNNYEIVLVQKLSMFLIPLFVINTISTRMVTAAELNKKIVKLSVISLFLNVFLNYLLSQYFGVLGIVMATMIVYGYMIVGINEAVYSDLKLKSV